ncbi:MAG TPA: hypothetical protein VFQ53_39540 [Kofleriaceae bacterium]|nr:hypothetical protein [Kofleriaceae bacterium]
MNDRKSWRERNPDAYNAAWRRWYQENAKRKVAWQARRRDELRVWWAELKATKSCESCGEAAPECLHFHHREPSRKQITLADVISAGWARERILDEVAQCQVLCANCHAKHHWDERFFQL